MDSNATAGSHSAGPADCIAFIVSVARQRPRRWYLFCVIVGQASWHGGLEILDLDIA
jgi:hypothetical protein